MNTRVSLAAIFVAVAALCSCDAGGPAPMATVAKPRASATARPEGIGVGQTTTVELTVTLPPGHGILRVVPDDAVKSLALLDVETLPPETGPGGSRHRSRYRLQARQTGTFPWSPGRVEITTPDGSLRPVRAEPVQIEVGSILADFPERTAPFGPRSAPEIEGRGWLPWVAGGALAGVLAWALLRRRARRHSTALPRRAPAEAPWAQARRELSLARTALASDATQAADAAAAALRRYMARRFGADASAHTTEELAAVTPPFAATSRWPTFLALLQELDAQRFPRPERDERGRANERIDGLLRRAEGFVEASLPPEPLR